ncbi:four helix bundle protein [bacterium]|nr:four helix bundle protein [bacterium]
MTVRTYRDLNVWQKSMDLIEEIYRITASFPRDEQFGITSQIRRSAVSVTANVAEGFGRGSRRDYARFVSIALGSARELEALLLVCVRIGTVTSQELSKCNSLIDEISRMLYSLRRRLLEPGNEVSKP